MRIQALAAALLLGLAGDFPTAIALDESLAGDASILQNFPNPFNPSTTIAYDVPHNSVVTLRVYDALGRQVRTLMEGEVAAGVRTVVFDAGGMASGTYFCRMVATPIGEGSAAPFHAVIRLTVLK